MDGLRQRMSAGLTAALKSRDRAAVAALRTALAAVANAEAVPASDKYQEPALNRSTEAPHRDLTEDQIVHILRAEAAERRTAIDEYETLGLTDQADRLRAELSVLDGYLGGPPNSRHAK